MATLHLPHAVLGAAVLAVYSTSFAAGSTTDVICSFAPSQHKTVTALSSAAGGAAATTAGIASALGLSVLPHSSGALILAGSGGYIAGTLGAAVVAPVIIGVGAVIGGTAVTVELLCAPKNHPEGSRKVLEAAKEFRRRTGAWVQSAKSAASEGAKKAVLAGNATVTRVEVKAANLYRRVFAKEQ